MDENNITSSEESTTESTTGTVESTTETTVNADEKANEEAAKPVSAFEMPSDNKTSAAHTYYSAPEPTPQNELESWSKTETESKPDTAVSYHSEPAHSSTPDTVYSSEPVYSSNQTAEEPFSTGFATASLILGILSILGSCCCIGGLFGILGLIFGCLQKKDESDKKPGMAIAGIITSIIGILFSLIALIYFIGMSYITTQNIY